MTPKNEKPGETDEQPDLIESLRNASAEDLLLLVHYFYTLCSEAVGKVVYGAAQRTPGVGNLLKGIEWMGRSGSWQYSRRVPDSQLLREELERRGLRF